MIKIVGLGNGNIHNLSNANIMELKKCNKIYTNFNNEIVNKMIEFKHKFVSFYEIVNKLNKNMPIEILTKNIIDGILLKNEDAIYGVAGNPMSDDILAVYLIKECKQRGIPYEVFSAESFLDNVITQFDDNLLHGVNIIKENNINEYIFNKRENTIITGISNINNFNIIIGTLKRYYGEFTKVYYFKNDNYSEKSLRDISFEFNGNFECIYIPKKADNNKLGQTRDIYDLFKLVEILRGESGCPWDKVQTHKSIENSMIEEAYEVVDAIEKEDIKALEEELGDVLYQIVFHVSLERNKHTFDFQSVISGIYDKMVYRHPHVFGNVSADNEEEVLKNWDLLKKKEKSLDTKTDEINAVAKYLPSLIRAQKVQKKVSKVGFDFEDAKEAANKVVEELNEVMDVYNSGNVARITEEIGDLIFSVVNISRILKIDSEEALRKSVDKFIARFSFIESQIIKEGNNFNNVSLDYMNVLWEKAKKIEK